jgi:hypothetical protein
MNTLITNKKGGARHPLILSGILMGGLLLGLTACSTTRQVTKGVEESGFLSDYSQLEKGGKGQADLIYINTSADWARYSKVWIKPVELWHADDPKSKLGGLSKEKQQMLVDYLHTSLHEHLGKDFQIVDAAGPDVLVVRVAITEGKGSKPVMNLISTVYPAGMVLSYGKQLIWGTGAGVGVATIEGEILDGATNQRLAAAVDRRAGTKALRTKFDGRWGDAKLCFDWWSQRMATVVAELKAGTYGKTEK